MQAYLWCVWGIVTDELGNACDSHIQHMAKNLNGFVNLQQAIHVSSRFHCVVNNQELQLHEKLVILFTDLMT
jgi:hypothetical protein